MDTETINLFSLYNTETNKKMNDFIKTLKNDEWEKEYKGYFNSIKSLCNHVYIGDFNWLKRFSKLKKFAYIQNDIFSKDIKFSELVFNTIDDYIEKRNVLDTYINDFINEIENDDLKSNLTYTDSRGNKYTKNFGGLIIHMFNHQTHHRGMISLYLEESNIANDFCNLYNVL